MQIDKKVTYIFVIVLATMLLISGSFLIFKSSAYLSQDKVVTTVPTKNIAINVVNENISITPELKEQLKLLIPKNNCNNEYLYKQFNGSYYLGINNPIEEECNDIKVFLSEKDWSSSLDEVSLTAYILLFDNNKYGKIYENLIVPPENITYENEYISKKSFLGYGGIYKFNFAKVNNEYIYTSTNYLNS